MNTVAKIVGTLVLLGLMAKFWVPLLLFVVGYVLIRWVIPIYRNGVAAHRAEQAAIEARADEQHAWVMGGGDRGIYGTAGAKLMSTIT